MIVYFDRAIILQAFSFVELLRDEMKIKVLQVLLNW